MPINLQEIRSAVIDYVTLKVTLFMSISISSGGTTINPNEDFSIDLTAQNAGPASGGIPLKDIIWNIGVQNDAVGKLVVPPVALPPLFPPSTTHGVARSGLSTTSQALPAGSQVKEMFFFPPTGSAGNRLEVGQSATIRIRGKAGSSPAGGNSNIQFKIFADIDMDWLFPKDQGSRTGTTALIVIG
jgi:hypothetical protein